MSSQPVLPTIRLPSERASKQRHLLILPDARGLLNIYFIGSHPWTTLAGNTQRSPGTWIAGSRCQELVPMLNSTMWSWKHSNLQSCISCQHWIKVRHGNGHKASIAAQPVGAGSFTQPQMSSFPSGFCSLYMWLNNNTKKLLFIHLVFNELSLFSSSLINYLHWNCSPVFTLNCIISNM